MPYCPICKKEYPNGTTMCTDCNTPLLEGTTIETVSVFAFQKEDAAQSFVEYMTGQGMNGYYEYSMRENTYKIYVEKPDTKRAFKMFTAFLVESKKKKNNESTSSAPPQAPEAPAPAPAEEVTPSVDATAASDDPASAEEIAPSEDVTAASDDSAPAEEIAPSEDVTATNDDSAPAEESAPSEDVTATSDAPAPVEESAPSEDIAFVTAPDTMDAATATESNEFSTAVEAQESIEVADVTDDTVFSMESDSNEEPETTETSFFDREETTTDDLASDSVSEEDASAEEAFAENDSNDEDSSVFSGLFASPFAQPEKQDDPEPIFVEVERVQEEEFDDHNIVDSIATPLASSENFGFEETTNSFHQFEAVDNVSAYDTAETPSFPYETTDTPSMEASEESEDDDFNAFSDFLANFKKASMAKNQRVEDTFDNEPAGSVVEEILPDRNLYTRDTSDYESVPLRPTDIQDTKITVPVDYDIIEEVIGDASAISEESFIPNSSSSFADPNKEVDKAFTQRPKRKFDIADTDELTEGFHGFVPDYSMTTDSDNEDSQSDAAYEEFKKRVRERKAEHDLLDAQITKERVRKANLEKEFGNGKKIVFEDTDELDNFAGFVPDYTPNTKNEEEFAFYKPRTVSDYSKYKKGKKGVLPESVAVPKNLSYMRLTNADEVTNLFVDNVPSSMKKTVNPNEIRNSNFIVSMNGRQLTLLFNSWLLLNVTTATVKTFEKADASSDENFNLKIDGIKKLLQDNFGELNESFLDNLVHKYYNKYLDD